jgi:hypothetical protein
LTIRGLRQSGDLMAKRRAGKARGMSEALSPVEAAHLEDIIRLIGGAPDLGVLRDLIKGLAYHEAGHVVGRMFTGHEAGHVVLVSIIPDGQTLGRERSERNLGAVALSSYPAPLKRSTGRCILLGLLAGEAAQGRIKGSRPGWLEEETFFRESETWEEEGTDFFRAERIAEIMAGPKNPPHVVLRWAARWAEEMVALPEVWATVETLAELLIERGEISDPEEIFDLCRGVLDMAHRSPKWKRRLFFSAAETKAMFG